jgi:hypothetical protein
MREAGEKTSGEETVAKKLAKKGFLAALMDYGKLRKTLRPHQACEVFDYDPAPPPQAIIRLEPGVVLSSILY